MLLFGDPVQCTPVTNLCRANGRGGFRSQTAADPLWGTPEKSPASHKMLTLQTFSSPLNAGTAMRGCLGRGKALGRPPAVCPPKRPKCFVNLLKDNERSRSYRKMHQHPCVARNFYNHVSFRASSCRALSEYCFACGSRTRFHLRG